MPKKSAYRKLILVSPLIFSTLFANSCGLSLREALLAGVYDFVSGSVTDSLGAALPMSQLLQPADNADSAARGAP